MIIYQAFTKPGLINSHLCKLGPCASWRNVCSDDNVDTCFNGKCYCGISKGDKCSGTTNKCTGGICKCGTNAACTATNVNTCSNNAKTGGTCTCGGNTACSGTTDTCTSGENIFLILLHIMNYECLQPQLITVKIFYLYLSSKVLVNAGQGLLAWVAESAHQVFVSVQLHRPIAGF